MTSNLSKCWKLNAGDKMLEMLAAAIHAIAKKMHDAGDEMSHRLCNLHSPSGGGHQLYTGDGSRNSSHLPFPQRVF